MSNILTQIREPEITDYQELSGDVLDIFIRMCIRKGIQSDIFRYIYKSYFSRNMIYPKKYAILLRHVKSDDCQGLLQHKLKDMIGTFIKDPRFIAYVSDQNEIFAGLYIDLYIKGVKTYRYIDNLETLAISWLLALYH